MLQREIPRDAELVLLEMQPAPVGEQTPGTCARALCLSLPHLSPLFFFVGIIASRFSLIATHFNQPPGLSREAQGAG
jgi:hypothetical protein